jgi:tetratricopeptide (TPR) repeat protein/uncharacterized protein YegL
LYKFQYIEFLLALAAIPVLLLLFFLALRWKNKTAKKIGDARLVKAITQNYSAGRFALKFVLIIVAFAAGVLALANLRSPMGSEKVSRNGIDVMIALDVSKSMLAQDIKPTRLDRAKQLLGKLIDKLSNDRIGIVVFAGKAYLQMPLTGDHGAAKMYLSSANTDIVPTQGTVVGEALKMCYTSFNAKEKKYKAVIVISDGEDHDETAVELSGKMAAAGVMINTIGIGSAEGATIVEPGTTSPKRDNEGNTVITKLNEDLLRTLADKGNGIYQPYTSTEEVVAKLDAQLSSMDQRAVTEDALINYQTFFQYFLLLSLLLLVIDMFIGERKRAVHAKTVISICFLFAGISATAQNNNATIKKGNEAYNKKEYGTAATEYNKVISKQPNNSTAQFNLGNALYKNKKTDDAIAAFDKVIAGTTNPIDKSKALYNKGVVLQNNKKLPECIAAYKQALKLNPADEDARQNLQQALKQLQQQQQQNKKQKQEDKKQQQEKEEPKPQPSKITKKDAEEKLKALLQQEKNLQDKLKKANAATPDKPEKDW